MTHPSAARGGPRGTGPGRRLRQRQVQAFTLLELMIVVSIVSVLTVVAIPSFQRARDVALVGTMVNELLGYAKVCGLINNAGFGETPSPPAVRAERGGVQVTQGCTGENQGATLVATWGTAKASGVACLSARSQISSSKATVTITPQSAMSCAFED